ncbi:MAG: FtsW/RodA/SpoVE family cell cycle protein, partial [Atribacterota bacterium]|nr:FtsW/RodA/SpoVE family cell cycle protein [Atribacterota bacterium]
MLGERRSSQFLSDKSLLNRQFRLIKHIDYTLIFLVLALCLLGLLVIYSTTHTEIINEETIQFTKRQLLYILVGLFLCFIVATIDYHQLEKIAIPIYILSIIMLVYVLLFGKTTGGARRWINVAGFDFQPSEFAKIALIIFLADFLSRQKDKLSNFLYFLLPFLFTGVLMLLIT